MEYIIVKLESSRTRLPVNYLFLYKILSSFSFWFSSNIRVVTPHCELTLQFSIFTCYNIHCVTPVNAGYEFRRCFVNLTCTLWIVSSSFGTWKYEVLWIVVIGTDTSHGVFIDMKAFRWCLLLVMWMGCKEVLYLLRVIFHSVYKNLCEKICNVILLG